MNTKRRLFVIYLAVVGFAFASGCATTYKPRGFTGGYEDVHIRDNVYYVSFAGNSIIDRPTLVKYFHRRALELCQQNGYRDYEIMDEKDHSSRTYVGSYGSGAITATSFDSSQVSGYVKCNK